MVLLVAAIVGFFALKLQLAMANPFGVGIPAEPQVGGLFDRLVAFTAQAQSDFYQGLTGALRAVETSSGALWALLGLSFLYGVVHAAGPGHGKVVIGSYMLASGETARRGALLAVLAAFLQASVAVLLVGLLAGLFGLGQAVLASATLTLERFSYALIIVLGFYLLWRLVRRLLPQVAPTPALAGHGHQHAHDAGHGHGHHHHHHPHDAHPHDHHAHGTDCGCDHAHLPDAAQVASARGLGQTLALVTGAGLRPCTGAILVLVLALGQGLYWQGAAAAYAMGAGTALTVGLLAALASGLAGLVSGGGGPAPFWVTLGRRTIEGLGALAIIGFGALLMAASLAR